MGLTKKEQHQSLILQEMKTNELNKRQEQILMPLLYWISVSSLAYKNYLEGRTYAHARVMREANQQILTILEANLALFTKEEIQWFVELSVHYRHWMAQFDDLVQKLSPDAYTEFVFAALPHSPRYPGESVKRLLESLDAN